MKQGIFAFAVASPLRKYPGERKRSSVQTVAEISGGIEISIRSNAELITILYVLFVRNHLCLMEIKIENTAATSAISQTDLEGIKNGRVDDGKRR